MAPGQLYRIRFSLADTTVVKKIPRTFSSSRHFHKFQKKVSFLAFIENTLFYSYHITYQELNMWSQSCKRKLVKKKPKLVLNFLTVCYFNLDHNNTVANLN